MKKIFKKLFLIGLFSFIFLISNVNALEINYSITYKYDETFYNNINSGNKLNNIHTYLNDNLFSYIDTNTIIQINPQSDTQWQLFIYKIPTSSNNRVYARTCSSSDDYSVCSALYGQSGWYIYNFTFDSDDNIINSSNSYRSTDAWPQIAWNYSVVNSDIVDNNYVLVISDKYYDTFYLDNSSTMLVYDASSSEKDIPIKFNDTTYSIGNYVNSKEFFDSFIPYVEPPLVCNKSQVLGFLSNVSDFTFRIKGESNALSEPIRGEFHFNYPNDITITNNDLIIDIVQFNDNEVVGNYKLNCPDNVKACYVEYSYNYIDDITLEVDFGIKVTFNTNNFPRYIQLYNCFHNDLYDYYNSSYTYTNISGSSSNNDSIISNFLQDGSQPDLDGIVDTSLIGDGPVDSILLLPLNIMNTLLNVLNSNTCQSLVLPLPFVNRDMTLPCISTIYSQINGLDTFLNWFSAIMSAFILYEYFIRLYKWVDDTLTFRENNHFGGF